MTEESKQVEPGEALLRAWNAWQSTEEFVSVLSWAENLLYIRENGAQGEIFEAFCAGYRATGGPV